MARQRQRRNVESVNEDSTQNEGTTATLPNDSTITKESTTMTSTTFDFGSELSLEDIEQISSGGREKGIYKSDMVDFINSGKLGIPYQFSGKKAASVKTGFESAAEAIQKDADLSDEVKEAAKQVTVRVRKDGEGDDAQEHVFLFREDLVKAAKAERDAK